MELGELLLVSRISHPRGMGRGHVGMDRRRAHRLMYREHNASGHGLIIRPIAPHSTIPFSYSHQALPLCIPSAVGLCPKERGLGKMRRIVGNEPSPGLDPRTTFACHCLMGLAWVRLPGTFPMEERVGIGRSMCLFKRSNQGVPGSSQVPVAFGRCCAPQKARQPEREAMAC